MLTEIAGDEDRPSTVAGQFFATLKRATIDGYYTSRIGIHEDLEYQGNTMLAAFPDCGHEPGR